MDEKPREVTSRVQLIYRFGWIFLGPAVVLFGIVKKLETGGGWLTNWNLALIVGYFICLVFRAADIRWRFGADTNGKPVTPKTWSRYIAILTAMVGGAYLVIGIVGVVFKR